MDIELLKAFNSADWNRIALEGVAYVEKKVRRLKWKTAQGLPKGKLPTDIFYDSVHKTLEGIKSAGEVGRIWNPTANPDLLDHLKDAIDSELSNLVTSEEHKTAEYFKNLDHKEFDAKLEKNLSTAAEPGGSDNDLLKQKMDVLKIHFKTEQDVLNVLDAFERLSQDEGPLGPKQVAQYLGIEVKEVNKTLKKIWRANEKLLGRGK